MDEIWKDVVGYEGLYSVSNLGKIKRDKSGTGICKAGRILKLRQSAMGYFMTCLYKNGTPKHFTNHSIIAQAFIGIRPKGFTINHKDGIKTNNHVDNLEYLTQKENVIHSHRNNLCHPRNGENHHSKKFKNNDIIDIRKKYINGFSYTKIASEYNVCIESIRNIILKKTWKHV